MAGNTTVEPVVDDMEMFGGIDEVKEKTPNLSDFEGEYTLEIRKIANHAAGKGPNGKFNARTQFDFKVAESSNPALPSGSLAGHAIWNDPDYGYHKAKLLNIFGAILNKAGEALDPKIAVAVVKSPDTVGRKIKARVFKTTKTKKNGQEVTFVEVRFTPGDEVKAKK